MPTVKDVAARAGVSIATVSRVINERGVTRAETARRVAAAIRELGFRPHGIGRSLKTARTRTIGIVIPDLANPVFAEAVSGIGVMAKAVGYSLLLASTAYRVDEERAAVEALRCRGVDGLILTVADPQRSPALDELDRDRIPYVLVYNAPAEAARPTVTVDNEAAGREIVGRLVARGHRRLGMVAGSFAASDRSRARHRGFLAGAAEAKLAEPALIEIDFSEMRLASTLAPLFARGDRPTALFCSNDLVAIAVIGALRELGFRVPADVSVIGFDGIAVGALIDPTLATIVQPSREMGSEAARALLDFLSRGVMPGHAILAHDFRPGGSLDAAPFRGPVPIPTTASGGSRPMLGRILRAAFVAAAFAAMAAGTASAQDVICYNCPPEWADWGTMLKAIQQNLGIAIPQDNKNSGQSLAQLIAEKANPIADFVYLGVSFGIEAKEKGVTQPFKPANWDKIPAGLKDPEGYWFTTHYGTLGLFVNKAALGGKPVPQSWADLLDPKYKGLVGFLDPTSAFVGYAGAVAVNKALGGNLQDFTPAIDYFKKLMKNDPIVPKQTAYARVLSGEIPILFDFDFNAYRAKYKDNAQAEFVIPKEGTIIVPYVLSLVKGAPHAEKAKKALDFIQSPKGQAIWANAFLRPVLTDAMPPEVAKKFLPEADYERASSVDYAAMAAAEKSFTERYLREVR